MAVTYVDGECWVCHRPFKASLTEKNRNRGDYCSKLCGATGRARKGYRTKLAKADPVFAEWLLRQV